VPRGNIRAGAQYDLADPTEELKVPTMKRLAALLLWLVMIGPLAAQLSVLSQTKPLPLGSGAWEVVKKVRGAGSEAELNLVFFDSDRCTLRVLDQTSQSNAALDRRLSGTRAVAGCNGGYFTPEFTPLGLMIAEGKRTGSFHKADLLTAVLMVRKGRPLLLWRDEFAESNGISDLLQCGPRLVMAGKIVPGLKDSRARERTFVFTDIAGHWAIGGCRFATLRELAAMLASPKVISEMKVQRAANLDGGGSSGLWWRDTSGTEHYDRETSTVRNFLAVLPR
jgi:uncharacterized protein YigE (DUF2233 family)